MNGGLFEQLATTQAVGVAGLRSGLEIGRQESQQLRDALAGLYGLLQLYAGRPDCPPWLKEWEQQHRAVAARVALANYEAHSG